jgi:predicted transcriptional regulator
MKTKNEALTLRVPADLKKRLQSIAKRDDRSLGWVVRRALEAYVAKETKQ